MSRERGDGPSLPSRWRTAARLVAGSRDVLEGRPDHEAAPPALLGRGWASFLSSLDEGVLTALEIDGLDAAWPSDTPSSLHAVIAAARATCALPSLSPFLPARAGDEAVEPAEAARGRRQQRPRKQAQVDAFARLIVPLATRAGRVLDVGSGHGHLTREIAERVAVPVVGLERNAVLAARARLLASDAAGALSYAVADVLRDEVPFAPGDCIIGLHACGELGDAVLRSAVRSGVSSVALLGCCLQKQRAPSRAPLCAPVAVDGETDDLGDRLTLPKGLLGLSNLTPRDDGVEASRAENLAARERRLALHRLLARAAPSDEVPRFGTELEGLNRRAAHLELPTLVARAFAHRALPPPPPGAIDEAAAWAHEEYARARRLQLPRTLLGRVLEVFVLLDRARFLEDHGYVVQVGVAFPARVSARNLVLIAARA